MDSPTRSEKLINHHRDSSPQDTDASESPGNSTPYGLNDPEKQRGSDAAEPPPGPPREIAGWKWIVVVLAIYSSQFLFALDQTIVANVQPVIVEQFDSVSKLAWLSVAFLIGAAGTNLVRGKIFAQFNIKWTYILCILAFEVGSAVCGAAPNIDAFIIGRAICGVSGAGMYVGLMTQLAVITTIKEPPEVIMAAGLVEFGGRNVMKVVRCASHAFLWNSSVMGTVRGRNGCVMNDCKRSGVQIQTDRQSDPIEKGKATATSHQSAVARDQ
jgi:hypothetical protein